MTSPKHKPITCVTAWLENQNVGPPKSLLASSHASLRPRGRKPARTPPPTFLFLPFHFSNSTGLSDGHATDKKAVEAASLPVRTGSERPEADEELRRNANPPKQRRAVMETLYGQRETVVNGWFVSASFYPACPLTYSGKNSSAPQTARGICPIFCTIPAQCPAVIWAAARGRSRRLRVGRNRLGQRA